MIFPNKMIPYRKSILSKFPLVLKELEAQDCSVLDLYKKLEKKLDSLSEYMDILDCLTESEQLTKTSHQNHYPSR